MYRFLYLVSTMEWHLESSTSSPGCRYVFPTQRHFGVFYIHIFLVVLLLTPKNVLKKSDDTVLGVHAFFP